MARHLALVVAAAAVSAAFAWQNGLKQLPHRARGGLAHRLLAIEGAAPAPVNSLPQGYSTSPLNYTQLVDHSQPNGGTFRQRYYVDTQFSAGSDAPVVLNLCGEGPCLHSPGGYILRMCEVLQATCMSLEHRFYGESIPGGNLNDANILAHLTVEAAMADTAAFINWYRADSGSTGKWLVVGGSYAGGLASFFKTKYPNLVSAAWASSGVVDARLEFPQFDSAVAAAIGPACADNVRAVTAAFETAVLAGGTQRTEAMELLGDGLSSLWNPDFFYMLIDSAAMAVQYSHKEWLCDALAPVPDLQPPAIRQLFANFTLDYWGKDFPHDCFYDTACLNSTAQASRWQPTARAWRTQKCTQLAWFQTAPATGSLRSSMVDLDYHLQQCKYIFSEANLPPPTTDAVNTAYGGMNPASKGTSNVWYSGFSDDPWQQVCLSESDGPTLPAFVAECAGCGHCDDLRAPKGTDSDALFRSRVLGAAFFSQWLK